jgi:hypothetical protein
MTDLKQAAQQALDALKAMQSYAADERKGLRICDESITALEAALAAQPEPVAWATMPDAEDWIFISGGDNPNGKLTGKWLPLYTATPQRQPLTDEQLREALRQCPHDTVANLRSRWLDAKYFARAIEAAHGIGGDK